MRFTILELDGTSREVTTGLAAKLAWETYARKAGLPLSFRLEHAGTSRQAVNIEGFPLDTYNAFQAWHADTGGTGGQPAFLSWADKLESVTPIPDDDTDPTQPGAGTDSS